MTASGTPGAAATSTPVPATIPGAMRGRFGLVPADCTTTMGDDKGLVTIGADSLKFYESVAKLTTATKATATHVEGTFAYEGEGMAWTRKAALDLSGNGKTLVLEEFGDDAVPGPRTYTRCPA